MVSPIVLALAEPSRQHAMLAPVLREPDTTRMRISRGAPHDAL
jgi:hypothetical protein